MCKSLSIYSSKTKSVEMNKHRDSKRSQFFLWNISHKSQPGWQDSPCTSEWGKTATWALKKCSILVKEHKEQGHQRRWSYSLSATYLSLFLQAWCVGWSSEELKPVADSIQSAASLNAACRFGWESLGARVRPITPLGHIYAIIMTRVNKSLIKKPVSTLPSGRKWISVSASRQHFPQELRNCRFQLFVAH